MVTFLDATELLAEPKRGNPACLMRSSRVFDLLRGLSGAPCRKHFRQQAGEILHLGSRRGMAAYSTGTREPAVGGVDQATERGDALH